MALYASLSQVKMFQVAVLRTSNGPLTPLRMIVESTSHQSGMSTTLPICSFSNGRCNASCSRSSKVTPSLSSNVSIAGLTYPPRLAPPHRFAGEATNWEWKRWGWEMRT